jgi:predicted dehydrogenase
MNQPVSRRSFQVGALAGVTAVTSAASHARILGSNDRVRVGCLGVGNRGVQVLNAFLAHEDAQIVALADVYEPYLKGDYVGIDSRFRALGGRVPTRQPDFKGSVDRYGDFRHVLDRNDIDAVIVATPDHWHAPQTAMACTSGKDVYVEKPLCVAVAEGRRMVDAARRNKRVVQVGTQRRSSPLYAELGQLVQAGAIGKVTVARAFHTSNMSPDGIGMQPDSEPPSGLDWDMWLGPRPSRAFNSNIMPYKFRWWQLYSSQMANWGVHYFDLMRWVLGETAPASLSAHGGVFGVRDSRTVPDTAEVVFEFASGLLLTFGTYEANGAPGLKSGEIELRGTLGTIYADIGRFEVVPERGGQFQDAKPRCKPQERSADEGYDLLDRLHARNFLDCVKSRTKPNADVEEGHRSTTMALLANIAIATKSRLDWDEQTERVTNCEAANDLLDYDYREPWNDLVPR